MPTVAIIGNCQAQAIEAMIGMHTDCAVVSLPPVFQLSQNDRESFLDTVSRADFVFAQRVSDTYPIEYVRTSFLKSTFSNIATWPTIYYNGYFPDIEYIYPDGMDKLVGPLDDYHMMNVFNHYKSGSSVQDCIASYDIERFSEAYPNPLEDSLKQLEFRELDVDLKISDVIFDQASQRKLFYTVNHPNNFLLREMARKMMACLGRRIDSIEGHPYALARVNIPIYAAIRERYGLGALAEGSFVGIGLLHYGQPVETAIARVYEGLAEIVDIFYRFYDTVPGIRGIA